MFSKYELAYTYVIAAIYSGGLIALSVLFYGMASDYLSGGFETYNVDQQHSACDCNHCKRFGYHSEQGKE